MHRYIPPPAIAAAIAILMWAMARKLTHAFLTFPPQGALALGIAAAALLLMLAAVIAFARAKTTINPLRPEHASHLISAGVFRLSRNPIYLADALLLLALALWLGNWLGFALVALFVLLIDRYQIRAEETALRSRFGQPYLEYCARVRRWI